MNKSELRNKYKSYRKGLSPDEIDALSLNIANQLLKLPVWQYTFYHIFLSIKEHNEVDTDYILNILAGKDKNTLVSKSDFETKQMTNYLLTDSTIIKKNSWNIPEPVDGIEIPNHKIDVVFVPLLAFDVHGNRVGYGKGFYDLFLKHCKPETVKIGLSFFEAEKELIQVNEHDVTLDYCVTPIKVYRF